MSHIIRDVQASLKASRLHLSCAAHSFTTILFKLFLERDYGSHLFLFSYYGSSHVSDLNCLAPQGFRPPLEIEVNLQLIESIFYSCPDLISS